MKIELDNKDINYINCINEDLSKGESIPLFIYNKDTKYNLEFTCNDIAKANAFVMYFMDSINKVELQEKLGITVTSIKYDRNYDALMKVRDFLQNMIDNIDDELDIFNK